MPTGKFSDQLNALAYASIDQDNDLDTIYDDSATELKYIAAVERIKRSLGSGDVSWMSALSTLASIDRGADKLLMWDNSASTIKSVLSGVITDMLYTLGSEKVRNVLFYGADPTGATSSKQAFIDTLAALTDGDVVIIPPGNYVCTAFGSQTFTESRIHFLGIGQPIIDLGGSGGFVLSGNQTDITFEGIHFKNFGSCLSPNSSDDTKTNITITRCKFYDSTDAGSHHAVLLLCRIKGATITNNTVQNIGSSSGSAYAIILGEKGDNATRTPDPAEEYDYGYDGSVITSAESSLIVTGNRIQKLRGNSDTVTGILVDGWRPNIANNVIEDIYSSNDNGGVGIYFRGHEGNIQGNNVIDCSHAFVTIKGAVTDPAVGDTGHTNLSGNIFRTAAQTCYVGSVELDIGNVRVCHNKFVNVAYRLASGAHIYDAGVTNLEVTDNEFYKVTGSIVALTTGSQKYVLRNKIILPLGNGASECELFNVSPITANASHVVIKDNEIVLGTNYVGTATLYVVRVQPTASRLITGLDVINNSVRGMAAFRTVKATTAVYIVQGLVRTDTQINWTYLDNYVDEWNETYTIFCDVQLSGATIWPTGLIRRARVAAPYTLAADMTANAGHSGMTFDNIGQAAERTISLPVATPGQEFTAERVAAYAMYFDPNGSETIGDGSAGKYLKLTKHGRVKVACRTAGQWTLTEMTCWDDPGSSGAPTAGFLWET